ncbi:MAG: radical SAM protein, partial [Promethearchaeota archaeon]
MTFNNSSKLGKPKKLVIEFSHNCNLACIMCGYGGGPIIPEKFMNYAIFNKILDHLELFNELTEIRLNGRGESTIHPKFMQMFSDLETAFPRMNYSIFTNLMFGNDEILELFSRYDIDVYVSLDSMEIKLLKKIRRGIRPDLVFKRIKHVNTGFIVFTLQQINFNEITNVAEFAVQNGLGFILNVLHSGENEYHQQFLEELEHNWFNIISSLETLHDIVPIGKLLIPDQIWGREVPASIATTTSCGKINPCPNAIQEIMIA